jgi:hypothetical protein
MPSLCAPSISFWSYRDDWHWIIPDSHIYKSENCALTLSTVWLLVRAVAGGAIPKAFGIMAKTKNCSSEHLARTNEPEAKQQISNISG